MLCIFNWTTFTTHTHTPYTPHSTHNTIPSLHTLKHPHTHRQPTQAATALPTGTFMVVPCVACNASASSQPAAIGNSTARGSDNDRHGSRPPPRGDSCWSASHLITFWRSPGRIRLNVCSICIVRYCRCRSRTHIVRYSISTTANSDNRKNKNKNKKKGNN